MDGEHDAVAEAVIALLFGPFFVVKNHQAALNKQRVVIVRKNTSQCAPALACIAQPELLGNSARQTTPFQVIDCLGGLFKLLFVGFPSFFQHIGERRLALPLLSRAGPILRAAVVFGHLHAVLLGQIRDRFNKAHASMLHQEADGVAIFSTAKTMVELLGRTD